MGLKGLKVCVPSPKWESQFQMQPMKSQMLRDLNPRLSKEGIERGDHRE